MSYCPNVGIWGLSGRGSSRAAIGLLSRIVDIESKSRDVAETSRSLEAPFRLRRL